MKKPWNVPSLIQKEEHNIDFRVPGLSHSVVKDAERLRVQQPVQRIENHPHRAALQANLQQNNVYNPFSKDSKEMIRELGNVDLFELCETFPKVQCSHCLLYIDHFQVNPERLGKKEDRAGEFQRLDHLFVSMFNDIEWNKNDENCISNAEQVNNYSNRFLPGHWTFLGPGSEKKWYGNSYDGQRDRTAHNIVQQLKETGHPIFTATSALSRGILKQRKGRSTIHFNEEFMNTELLFQTIHSG